MPLQKRRKKAASLALASNLAVALSLVSVKGPLPPAPPRDRIGGKYELLEVAGRGGMSTVWRGLHHGPGRFRRPVAVKQLFPHLAEQQLYLDMFLEEARIGAVLSDPNIAQIYDFLAYAGDYYLVMEWVEGLDLFTYIDFVANQKKRRTQWDLMVAVVIGMLRGLAAAHERVDDDGQPQPIVHRDVTPHNVLIGIKGSARLIDFGLGLARDRLGDETDPGIAKGKFAYLSPEVVGGARPNHASDQFSAGVVLWEALTGKRLFAEEDQINSLKRIAKGDIPPLKRVRSGLPRALHDIVHKALAMNPEERHTSAREMANRLSAVLANSSRTADTYATLSKTVLEARNAMGLGHRPQGERAETPLPMHLEESGVTELPDVTTKSGGLLGLLPALWPFKK